VCAGQKNKRPQQTGIFIHDNLSSIWLQNNDVVIVKPRFLRDNNGVPPLL
jgi:hypothetical protein